MTKTHAIAIRIYYEDTDFSGYVYHAAYLKFFERGRTEYLRSRGTMQSLLQREEAGLVFVVGRITIDYVRPALMDDLLTIETEIVSARGPLVHFRQSCKRGSDVLSRADVNVVAVRDGRPVRLPQSLRAAFADGPATSDRDETVSSHT